MPFSQIPREAFDEAGFEYPEKRRFGEHRAVFDHIEGGFVLFLGKDSNRMVALG
jgi:hypothetical protein